MLDILNNYILGQLGDQSGTLWLGSIFYSKKFELLNSFSFEIFRETPNTTWDFLFSNLYNFIFLSFSYFLGPIFSYNLITFIVLFLNSFFLYKLLSFLKVDKSVGVVFGLLFSFIPYFYLHFEHHTLLFVFPSIYALYISLKSKISPSRYDFLNLSLAILLQTLFSLYLGYFLILYLFLYFILDSISSKNFSQIFFYIKSIFIFIFFYLVFSFNFIYNFLNPESTFVRYNYPEGINIKEISSFEFDRVKPLDDFIFFSSRPWYFLLPPSNHFLFGQLTKDFISYFAIEKNLFIFKNHFPYEHNASFIGYFIIMCSLLSLRNNKLKEYSDVINKMLILSIIVFILTMPPVIFLMGKEIYTPSYLLYLLFPMFRTLSRFVVFLHLSLFIVSAIFISSILQSKKQIVKIFLLFIFFSLIIFEYFLSYKKVFVPSYIESSYFISSINKEKNLIAAYPSSFRTELLLNMPLTNSPLINPTGFNVEDLNFDSSKFTNNLINCTGIKYFHDFKGKYIVIKLPAEIENTDLEKFTTIFESNNEKIIIKDVSNFEKICN